MRYLSFSEYTVLGGTLSQSDFHRASFAAAKKIDNAAPRLRLEWATVGETVAHTVKMLMLELIERGLCGDLGGEDVTSVSNNGYSVSYESREGKADSLIREYLSSLLFDDDTGILQDVSDMFSVPAERV